MGVGYQGHSLDRPETSLDDTSAVEIRVRNAERRGRFDYFRPGALGQNVANRRLDDVCSSQNVGSGWGHELFLVPSGRSVRTCSAWSMFLPDITAWILDWVEACRAKVGRSTTSSWYGAEGFPTGSQTTPNTVMLSFGFERADMNCGAGCDASPGAGYFHSQTILNRETALWYWIQPSLVLACGITTGPRPIRLLEPK